MRLRPGYHVIFRPEAGAAGSWRAEIASRRGEIASWPQEITAQGREITAQYHEPNPGNQVIIPSSAESSATASAIKPREGAASARSQEIGPCSAEGLSGSADNYVGTPEIYRCDARRELLRMHRPHTPP